MVAGVDESVDQRAGRRGDQERTEYVEPAACPGRGLPGQHPGQAHGDDQTDGHVDEEHPWPARSGGEHAAQQHAECGAATAESGPHAERLVPIVAVEQRDDERQCRWRQQRRADSLGDAAADELTGGVGQSGHQRGHHEEQQAGEHHPLGPDQVREPPAQQDQPAERQRVCADSPGQGLAAGAEVGLDVRQRDGHHGHVEDQHQLSHGEESEDPPAQRVRRPRVLCLVVRHEPVSRHNSYVQVRVRQPRY